MSTVSNGAPPLRVYALSGQEFDFLYDNDSKAKELKEKKKDIIVSLSDSHPKAKKMDNSMHPTWPKHMFGRWEERKKERVGEKKKSSSLWIAHFQARCSKMVSNDPPPDVDKDVGGL